MSSATDILYKHAPDSRYLYRDPSESLLAYQISGFEPQVLAEAACKLQQHGANLLDINCGCPKPKIRKKGAGSALLENPQQLLAIITAVRAAVSIPLTVKIRLQGQGEHLQLAKMIEQAGADALIVHGRCWDQDYDVAADWIQIAKIKQLLSIPVVANGDIYDDSSLKKAIEMTGCDAYMIARAGSGRPWLYQELLGQAPLQITEAERVALFMMHLQGLAKLEDEYKAVLQSKSLVRYYFRKWFDQSMLSCFYRLTSLEEIQCFLLSNIRGG